MFSPATREKPKNTKEWKVARPLTLGFAVALTTAIALAPGCGDEDEPIETDVTSDESSTDDGSTDDGSTEVVDDTVADTSDVDGLSDLEEDTGAAGCFELADGSCVRETFSNPPVLEPDSDGVHNLSIGPTETTIAGQRHCVRAYNSNYTAPTIDTAARVGDTQRQIRINMTNRHSENDFRSLEGDDCSCQTAAGEACMPGHLHDMCGAHTTDCTCTTTEGDSCEHMFNFNVTNLHAHGSHVRPDYSRGGEPCEPVEVDGITVACRECGNDICDDDTSDDTCYNADNVINSVHPQEGAQYRWDIDEDGTHHTGLQWYHPHIHGTTAIQVASGAAGAWIVRGALDELDGIANARERVMIFSTPSIAENGFEPLAEGETCSDDTITFNDFSILSATSSTQLNVLNGVHRPRLVTAPGQVERWRIVHAGFLDEVFLGLLRGSDSDCSEWSTDDGDIIQLTQIGRDGLIMPQQFEHDNIFMSPGYRVEAMVGGEDFADGDTWCLVASRFLQPANTDEFGEFGGQPMSPDEAPTASDILTRFETAGDLVAIVNVAQSAGTPTETDFPDYEVIGALAPSMELDGVSIADRCAAAQDVTEPSDIDQAAVLQVGAFTADDPDPCDCKAYNVNCNNFEDTDRHRYAFDRDMELGAVEHWRVAASVDGHPFHIHINPFVVCPEENVFDPMPFPHWRDTYLVNLDRKIDVITENRSYTGPFVFHCHKLTHEDHGMMELIRVCDPETDGTCGDYAWRKCDDDDLSCHQALAATDCVLAAPNDAAEAACVVALGGAGQVCGPGSCRANTDCPNTHSCGDAEQCELAPCGAPCGPGESCIHGTCE